MARICLITTGQPSTNPRLIKEADALTEAGHEVRVVCAYWAAWALETDRVMADSRPWSFTYAGGTPGGSAGRYLLTRLRHAGSRRIVARGSTGNTLRRWAICRALPELERSAKSKRADLYIAHNLGALPAAVAAARTHSGAVGFDAEDFHSGMRPFDRPPSGLDEVVEGIERQYLPLCDYVTAASPGIAEAYASTYGIPLPVVLLNVFPLSLRPPAFRPGGDGSSLRLYWFSQTIGPERGLEDIMRALALLRGRGISLHVRGQWQGNYRECLLRLAGSLGTSRTTIIEHPIAAPDDMVRLASRYDVGLALETPDSENRNACLSNKLFTYLLAGNAVAATATPGQRCFIETIGPAGFTYPHGDVETLARGLERWCQDRAALQHARRHAWEYATRRYNWDLEKRKLLAVVNATLTQRQARRT